MRVSISKHALERAAERGATQEEIRDVLRSGKPVPAKYGKLGRRRLIRVDQIWRGVWYPQKTVEVYYVVEGGAFIVITVYVFFWTWESLK